MLSVSRVSASQAVSYYSGDNYYTKDQGVEESSWFGKGAELLGLHGKVRPGEFEHLLAGKDPSSKAPLVGKASVAKGHKLRAGLDMTFSAPKSVTLASLVDERVIACHRRAVEDALSAVEEELSYVRLGKERKVHAAGNLTVAQFHHDSSRKSSPEQPPDPQLHTHCVALNMVHVRDDQGRDRWMSLYNDGVFNNSKLFGMVYQNSLAQHVRKLGYDIQLSGNGTFEIQGYTREQLEEFSKRTKQIEELHARSKKEERALKMGQRLAKVEDLSREKLKETWFSQCKEIGITHPKPSLDPVAEDEIKPNACERAIDSAIAHFSERDVSFRDKKALAFAFENHIGQISSYKELKSSLRDHEKIISYSKNYFGDHNLTTSTALLRERETLRLLDAGRGSVKPLAVQGEIDRWIASKPTGKAFTQGQAEAFRLVATTTDQIVGWQGVAGAGKSYALNDFRQLCEKKGLKVIGLAPDASAAKVLGDSAHISDPRTVASFLQQTDSDEAQGKQVWIVDEAGKMNAREMHELMSRAVRQGARMVLVGDTRQLSAVEAGNPFRLLQDKGMTTAHLTEHRRQKSEQLKTAVELVSKGSVAAGLTKIRSQVVEGAKLETRVKKLTAEFMELAPSDRQKTLVLAGSNQERRVVLDALRGELKAEGALSGHGQLQSMRSKDLTREASNYAGAYDIGDTIVAARNYRDLGIQRDIPYRVIGKESKQLVVQGTGDAVLRIDPAQVRDKLVFTREQQEIAVGDRLKWTRNDYRQDRRNGQELVVKKLAGDRALLASEDGKEVSVDLKREQYLDHSLVSTAYSSQGKTADRVLLVCDRTIGRESMYVALSRTKYEVKIFADSFDGMVARAQRSQAKSNATDLLEGKRAETKVVERAQRSPLIESVVADLKSGKTYSAYQKIESHITEVGKGENLFFHVAERYAALSKAERAQTLLVAGNREQVRVLRSHVRKKLHEKGELQDLRKVELLVPKAKGEAPEVGDILIPTQGSSRERYRKGVQYQVTAVDRGKLILETPSGQKRMVRDAELPARAYRKTQDTLAAGDRVYWQGLDGRKTLGWVQEMGKTHISVGLDDGRMEKLPLSKPLPIGHGVVQSPFERIGGKEEQVVVACESNIGSKALWQGLDRAFRSFEVVVADKQALAERLGWYQRQGMLPQDKRERLSIELQQGLSV